MTIFSHVAGGSTGSGFWGQLVTTPSGGPWNNIEFNLYDAVGGGPRAGGQLFVLTSEYLGMPQNLSAATPGFFASTADIAGNVWMFAPGVVLAPDTQYFFYTTVELSVFVAANDSFAQGIAYEAFGADQNYFSIPTQDVNFLLAGDVVGSAIPEPSTLSITAAGLAGLALLRLRRRKRHP